MENFKDGIESLIKKFPNTPNIIFPYSEEWMKNNKRVQGFSGDEVKTYNRNHGLEYINHLAVIHLCDDVNDPIRKELINIFPSLGKFITGDWGNQEYYIFWPRFIFVNFITNQILLASLHKRNRLFLSDGKKYLNSINPNIRPAIVELDLLTISQVSEYQKIMNWDYANVIYNLVTALDSWGDAVAERSDLPEDWEFELANKQEPDDDGLIEVEFSSDPISAEELDDLWQQYTDWNGAINQYESEMKIYFPTLSMAPRLNEEP